MNLGLPVLGLLLGAVLSGCQGGIARHAAPEESAKKPAQSDHARPSAHILAVDSSGNYLPISDDLRFRSGDGRRLLRTNAAGGCVSFRALNDHISDMFAHIDASGKKKLLIFIHGGMISIPESLKRIKSQYRQILNGNDGSYPIFIVWRSGLMSSYWEQLCCIRGGQYNVPLGTVTLPLYLLKDIGVAVFNAPLAWGHATYVYWSSIAEKKNVADVRELRCDVQSASSLHQARGDGVNYCHKGNKVKEERILHDTFNFIMFFPKMVTIPFVSSMGKTGWDNMLRRTETQFRNPIELSDSSDTCATEARAFSRGSGATSIFFSRLERYLADRNMEVSIVGHSMGSIIVNKTLELYPDIRYRHIVFMAAADSINNTINALGDYMQKHPETEFYNVMMHPQADANEIPRYTFGIAPNGSLLEWIDEMYGPNRTRLDLTAGKWWNSKDILHLFPDDPQLRKRIHMKVFGFYDRDPVHHGDFTEIELLKYPYWDHRFWWLEDELSTGN